SHLDRCLGHVVTVHPRQGFRDVRRCQVAVEQPRQHVAHEDVLRAVDVLRRVVGFLPRDALAPALGAFHHDLDQEHVLLGLHAEGRLEGRDQVELDAPELDRLQPHAHSLSSCAISSPDRTMSAAAAFSSSCRTLEAPGIATTFGVATSQASATWAAVAWCGTPTSRSAPTSVAPRALASALKSLRYRRRF